MNLIDVNVLIYAANREADQHPRFRAWLATALGGADALACASHTLASVVRILTHDRLLRRPLTVDQALTFAQSVRSAPSVHQLEPGEQHWNIFAALCRSAKAKGNLAMDAWLAALAIENGCTLITTDRDFARFDGLQWRHPLRD